MTFDTLGAVDQQEEIHARPTGQQPRHRRRADLPVNLFAAALARNRHAVRRLLETHVADEHGMCCGCTKGGTGLPGTRWPCALRFHAAAADQMMDGGLPPDTLGPSASHEDERSEGPGS